MKLPLSWLKEYVDLTLPPKELCRRLTMAGLESALTDGDRVLETEVTPNRPDWLSVLGTAWEIAALSGAQVRQPQVSYQELGAPIGDSVEIAILDPDLCHRYTASLVTGMKVGPSPGWMQERLLLAGVRPISNIVDITNYVMLEYGQPLHAFDCHKLQEGKVLIRRAREGEHLGTLDGVERALAPDTLVIADARRPIGIAGVMGGANTEVWEGTTAILLESANFQAFSVRHTSSGLGLRTEASLRFEKGISAELALPALRRATQLFLEMAGGQASQGVIDLYPRPQERPQIALSQEDLRRILGVDWPLGQARGALTALGFDCRGEADSLRVRPPSHRADVQLVEDVVEEVARIIGYDAIPTTSLRGPLPGPREDPLRDLEEQARDILVGYGLQDLITYSLLSAQSLERARFSGVEPIRLANPMSREQEYLRPTLRANLLSALAVNQRYGEEGAWLFEVGRVFWPRQGDLPEERRQLGAVLCGSPMERSWAENPQEADFFQAKGLAEGFLRHLGVTVSFALAEDPFFSPGRAAVIRAGDSLLGIVGEVHPLLREDFQLLPRPVCFLELDLDSLLPHIRQTRRFQVLPRYPGVAQDLSVLVGEEVLAARLLGIIQAFPLVAKIALFDVFTGGALPPGKKSLTFSLLYQSSGRTLTGEEVAQVQSEIVERLGREVGATLRS